MSMGDGLQGWMYIRNGNGDGTFQPPVTYLLPGPLRAPVGPLSSPEPQQRHQTRHRHGHRGVPRVNAAQYDRSRPASHTFCADPDLPGQDATPTQPVVLDWSDVNGAAMYRSRSMTRTLLGAAYRGSDRVDIPAHRPHHERAAAMVAGAGLNSAGVPARGRRCGDSHRNNLRRRRHCRPSRSPRRAWSAAPASREPQH